jgi:hypothetical protein
MFGILATLSRFLAGQMSTCTRPAQNRRNSSAPRAGGGNTYSEFVAPSLLCSRTYEILSFADHFPDTVEIATPLEHGAG